MTRAHFAVVMSDGGRANNGTNLRFVQKLAKHGNANRHSIAPFTPQLLADHFLFK